MDQSNKNEIKKVMAVNNNKNNHIKILKKKIGD